jgi:hypothetical protein
MRTSLISRGRLAAVVLIFLCSPLHGFGSPRPDCSLDSAQPQSAPPAAQIQTGRQSPPAQQPLSLNDQIAQQVLDPLRRGMEAQNLQLVLSVFDKQPLDSSADLPGQLRAFFQQYAEVHFRYQLLQATADKNRASATAELQMDAQPYQPSQIPWRRTTQVRFALKREAKGWKVTEFSPSDFFSLEFNRPGPR